MISVALKPKETSDELDPARISFTNEFHILDNLTTRLVSIDEEGRVQQLLASKIIKISDLEYHFKINDFFFANGELITLLDVKKTIERAMIKGSSHAELTAIIKSIDITADTLRIHLNKVSKSLFYYLSLPDLGVLHSKVVEKDKILVSDYEKFASGPYSYSNEGGLFYLVKNKFDNRNDLSPKKVRLIDPFQKDIAQMILRNEIDLGQVSYDSFFRNQKELLSDEDINFLGVPSDALTYIFFNRNSKKYKDISLRQKISKIISQNFKLPSGYEELARRSYQYFPPESKAYIPSLSSSQNTAITESQASEKLVIHTFSTAYNVTVEPLVKSLETISGLKIEVVNDVQPKDYKRRIESGDIDIFLTIMSTDFRMPVEAINFEYLGPNAKFVDYDGKIEKLYNEYDLTFDAAKEVTILQQISKIMLENYQFIPLFHNAIPFFYKSSRIDIQGLSHLFILNFDKIKLK